MKRFFARIRNLTAPPDSSGPGCLERHTQTLSIWEGSLWAVMWGFGETYLAPYAVFLQASNLAMAFIGSGPVLIAAIAQLAGAAALDRTGRRMPIILTGFIIQALCYLPIFLLPQLLPSGGIPLLLLCITVLFFAAGFAVPSWMSLMGDVVEPGERGTYFARRTRTVMIVMLTSMLLAGITINLWKHAGYTAAGFGSLFFIACMFRIISIFFMRRHHDAPFQKTGRGDYFSFFDFIRATPRSNFARFALTVALMNGAAQIAGPFFAVYMLRDLQWTYMQFTVNMVIFLLSQTLFVRWWGTLSDRHGNRSVLAATSWLMTLLPVLWIVSTNYLILLFAQVISGACWSGFNLAASNFIYDAVTPSKRARVFSYYNLLNGIFSVAGGVLIGAPLAKYAPGSLSAGGAELVFRSPLLMVFVVSILARIAVARLMLPRFTEVRAVEPVSTRRILWRLGTGQPVFAQAAEFLPVIRKITRPNSLDEK